MSCQCNAVSAIIQLCRGFSGAQIRSIWPRFADGVKGQEMSTRRDWRTDLVFQVGRQRTKRINLWNKYLFIYLSTSLNKCKYNICMSLTVVCHFTCISYSDPHTDPMSLRIEGRSIFTLHVRKIKPRTVTWPAQGRWGKKCILRKPGANHRTLDFQTNCHSGVLHSAIILLIYHIITNKTAIIEPLGIECVIKE